MKTPQVNLNGTSVDDLIEEYTTAGTAIKEAGRALGQATCNGRDFPNSASYVTARNEKEAALDKLSKIFDEIEAVVEGLWEQKEARERQKAGRY